MATVPHKIGLSCSYCDSTFRRAEHLSRHLLSHTGEKPHYCPVCNKAFTRRDSLRRHISLHEPEDRPRKVKSSARISRACNNCARARLKCDGVLPCSRCHSRHKDCIYPRRSRNRISVVEELRELDSGSNQSAPSPQEETGESADSLDNQPTRSSLLTPNDSSQSANPQASQFQTPTSVPIHLDGMPGLQHMNPALLANLPHSHQEIMSIDSSMADAYDPLPKDRYYTTSVQTSYQTLCPPEDEQRLSWDFEFGILDCLPEVSGITNLAPHGSLLTGYESSDQHNTGDQISYTQYALDTSPDFDHNPSLSTSHRSIIHTIPCPPSEAGSEQRDAANLPANSATTWPTQWDPKEGDNIVEFPDMSNTPADLLEAENYAHVEQISEAAYQSIQQCLMRTASETNHYRAFRNPQLPAINILDCFIQLYFEYFHPNFPLIHIPTFNATTAPWQLLLALAAIGCQYSKIPHANQCSKALQELLLRALLDTTAINNLTVRQLWFTQAVILNLYGMMYTGDRRLLEMAEVNRNASNTICRRSGAFKRPIPRPDRCRFDAERRADSWSQWVQEESLRRAAFCSFMVDVQIGLHFNGTPCVAVEEVQQSLPCHEKVWEAADADQWAETYQAIHGNEYPCQETINSTLTALASREPLKPLVGKFARLLVGLSVYRRCMAAFHVLNDPFLSISAISRSSSAQVRNTALSTLQAVSLQPWNGHILSPSDSQLLLAAMLLCVPQSVLLQHAQSFHIAGEPPEYSSQIKQWIEQEGGKTARRAVWYAGSLFGVLRERRSHAPYESIASLLCVITLWTYSLFSESADTPSVSQGIIGPGRRAISQSIIRLDRSCNENMLQEWTNGQSDTRVFLKDIGDISRLGATGRILSAGVQHLGELGPCGLSQSLLTWLRDFQSLVKSNCQNPRLLA